MHNYCDNPLCAVGGDDNSGHAHDPGGALHQQVAPRQGTHPTWHRYREGDSCQVRMSRDTFYVWQISLASFV